MTRRGRPLSLAVGALTLIVVAALFWPLGAGGPASHPRPAADYDEAIVRFDRLRALDTSAVNPLCRTELMTHGLRTRRVIVFLHGLTNCPRQFQRLGDLCFARGDNVLIARLPRHGFADRMTPELARLTAAEMATFTDEVVDIGRGLGDSVTVAGLSLGGVMAAWAAQNRPDLDRAVVIAPLLGLPGVPVPLDRLLTRWWLATPNRFYWWDDKLRAEVPGPRYCYPRYGTKAIGELLELGFVVSAQASRERPGAREIVMVTNGNDHAIDNRAVASLADAWRRHGATRISSYEFPAGLDVGHDLIDPEQPYQRTETVYPKLLELLEPPPQPHDKE